MSKLIYSSTKFVNNFNRVIKAVKLVISFLNYVLVFLVDKWLRPYVHRVKKFIWNLICVKRINKVGRIYMIASFNFCSS